EAPRIREALVTHLLENPAAASQLRHSRRRWRLRHPGLLDQLRDALQPALEEDCGEHLGNPIARRAHTAILIARSSLFTEASPYITSAVLKPGLNPVLRASAAFALADLN